jgi:hypothetical protein
MKVKIKSKTRNVHLVLENQWEVDFIAAVFGATPDTLAYNFGMPKKTGTCGFDIIYDVFEQLDFLSENTNKSLKIELEK